MNLRALWIGVVVTAASAAGTLAAVSPDKADWGKGPVQWIMTADEADAWKALRSDAAAGEFIDLFWARRDPTPGTPRNEYHEEFDAAVKAADAQFTYRHIRGSMTDPGRILILFGAPAHAKRTAVPRAANDTAAGAPGRGRQQALRNTEIGAGLNMNGSVDMKWTYEGADTQKYFGKSEVELTFRDQYSDGQFKLVQRDLDLAGPRRRAIDAAITQPQLTSVPSSQATGSTVSSEVTAPQASGSAVRSPLLEAALAEAEAGKSPKGAAALSYAEFVSPSGDSYVPVQLYVPAAAGAGASGADTIFGAVDDASGNRVAAFEERASLTPSKRDFFVDKTLTLPAGRYTASLGLAHAGQPLLVTSGPIEVTSPASDAAGTSRLILSNNIYVESKAEPARAPFAFGHLKIVPKGDLRFSTAEDLNYFVEINNPGIDPATNLPKILYQLDLSGEGSVTRAPLAEAPVMSLSGVPGPGHYVLTSSIPLGQVKPALKPGDYTLKMKIVDSISKLSYNIQQSFTITAP